MRAAAWLHAAGHWLRSHPWAVFSLVLSALMVAGSAAAAYVALRRLPPDYFVRAYSPRRGRGVRVARTITGALLIVAGVAMLVLPGQGVLAILLGLALIDFPAKHRAMRWILCRRTVAAGMNRVREKLRVAPFVLPSECDAPAG